MKIYAPVKDTNGVYASVLFVNGVGETDDIHLIEWFRNHGYKVPLEDSSKKCDNLSNNSLEKREKDETPDFTSMTPDELRDWMREHGYGAKIKNTKNKDKLLEIMKE